ncbi:hypothetical protein PMAYCL1PPCAC_23832 [Pristionchus mayeri]|uniref:TFIIS N-terminal domain-containing protein n=1 Tax=Pristionchus mayeri TaxID=1317129 RepID=A0AAN5I5Z9_9BILA|nr:hypothetical protein PMAYCL1PPCAC_23832 [Pristionchus mayeri]
MGKFRVFDRSFVVIRDSLPTKDIIGREDSQSKSKDEPIDVFADIKQEDPNADSAYVVEKKKKGKKLRKEKIPSNDLSETAISPDFLLVSTTRQDSPLNNPLTPSTDPGTSAAQVLTVSSDSEDLTGKIEKYIKNLNEGCKIGRALQRLERIDMTIDLLTRTGVGKVVKRVSREDSKHKELARSIVAKWKDIVMALHELKERSSSSIERRFKEEEIPVHSARKVSILPPTPTVRNDIPIPPPKKMPSVGTIINLMNQPCPVVK